ncbi:cyclic nucleotide-binding domain-containing protein [Desulforhopalus sp. 52FAK]
MKRNELQVRGVEVLKSFNNAISTSRIYPPEAPQVTAAVDRGYKSIKEYLRLYKVLKFDLIDGQPHLCGTPLHQDVLDSFPNLYIYRQLKVLGLASLSVTADMDRFTFHQLLTVFQGSVAKIKEHGGGLEYVTGLGLANYFPESVSSSDGGKDVSRAKSQKERNILKVRPELVLCLLGKDKRPLVIEDLKKRIGVVDSSVSILAATIARILQGIRQKKKIIAAAEFPKMFRTAETLIDKDQLQVVATQLAEFLAVNLKDSALCVLFCQDFPSSLGKSVYTQLVSGLSGSRTGRIIVIFREQIARVNHKGAKSPEMQLLGKSLLALMNSEKGKTFLSAEKAKTIIHEGERERIKKRLNSGISGILEGDYKVLENEEFIKALPEGMLEMYKGPKSEYVPKVLKKLIIYLGKSHEKASGDVLHCLLKIGDDFLEANLVNQVEILVEPLILVVQRSALGSQVFEKIITFLQKMMRASWKDGEKELGDKILMLFYQMRSGQIEKSDTLKVIVGKVQDRGIDRPSLPHFLTDYLENPKDEALGYRLVLQGPVAVSFLVDVLIETEGSFDRLKIIDLLSYNTSYLPSIIHDRLPNHMPWYGKRNLIKLLGEAGGAEDAEAVLGFLKHSDFRVQREAFLCMYKIGGPRRKKLFLESLNIASETISIQIVEAFASFCDQEVASRLAILLEEYTSFSENTREPLLLALFDTLGRCPCGVSLRAVENFIATKGVKKSSKNISKKVWASADKALHFLKNDMQALKKKHMQASQLRKVAMKQLASKKKTAVHQRVITGLPEEQAIRNYLSKGEQQEGVRLLMLLIEQTARKRNFPQAEMLKEWLAEIDKTDVSNTLRAGEIIAREKIASIDKSHLEVWSDLYDALSSEEFSEVFEHLEHRKYATESPIVEQGEEQNALFFVNSGEVKIYYRDEGDDFLITTMESGEIFGADAFFEPSIWTMSVASVGDSDVSLLPVDVLQQWNKDFPELEEKLLNFCEQFERVESLIIKSSRDRRLHKRHQIQSKVKMTLIDTRGRSTGINAEAQFIDISQGGLACTIELEHKSSLRQLLGRTARIELPTGDTRDTLPSVTGTIVSVKTCKGTHNEYSVHLKFDVLLETQQLYDIIQLCRIEPASTQEM